MTWIRLEAANGLRVMAPSFSPPPRIEGIDKLFDYPVHARSFHCFRSCTVPLAKGADSDGGLCFMEEVLVLVQREKVGGKLDEVTIAVGGPAASREELMVVLDYALETIRRTNYSGTRLIFDALCTSANWALTAADETMEYDGLPTAHASRWEERRVSDWRASEEMPSTKARCAAMHPSAFLRRKALLFFVAQDVVPISLLYCRVSGVKSHGCVASVAGNSHNGYKDLQSLEAAAAHACKCLVDVIDRTLAAAFEVKEGTTRRHSLWSEKFEQLPFVAVFSTGGLLCASPSFFKLMDHCGRLLIGAVAVDQLSRWPTEDRPCEQVPLVHVSELLLKCGKDEVVLHLLFLGVGNAVCCVFAFRTAGEGTLWDAARILQFVNEHLRTSRTALTLDAGEDKSGAEHTWKEAAQEFAPHLLLCTASIYPTPWFHSLLYEMNRLEEETPKTVLLGKNGTPSEGLPSRLQGSCDCFSLFGRRGKKAASSSTSFVWHRDTVDLPLDVAWCVASSHVVKAEANACNKGSELGHYALFSILSSGTENAGETGRYCVGRFYHCWRSTFSLNLVSCTEGSNSSHSHYTREADPTKFLQGFSSIGAGPRAPASFEVRDGGGGLFHRGPRLEARDGDDAPVFASHMMTFPYSLLFEEDEAEEGPQADDVHGAPHMTVFYTRATHKVKGVACEAVLQEMLLMEGDLTGCEGELVATLLRQQRSKPISEAFSSCHEAAHRVLEDVWRASNA
ncbi:hypothetical protein TraAM80_08927 [Trypanosoma rangeli]|uniref:Uncharacterized protein n=1 Tax=Trypanosoma rangeli TaxID=5698 RepID=A0A3R7M2J4_TRYRA|nr:uncharacterized protein TraAM80_08927 [Trypanosoma rangeli]RNE98186.1 hypothetical protein TraAM80_08927 [Trypanosoma rangeli]|eukprot:RNE98186.1 hypothetical protein TraAM80_08927 [Trypanosoma rangeli]